MVYIISSHVVVRYMRLPTKLLYNVGSTWGLGSSLVNFSPRAIEIGIVVHDIILNHFNKSIAYLDLEMDIPSGYCCKSTPRK